MRRASIACLTALGLFACGDSKDDAGQGSGGVFTVDCLGMVPQQVTGAPEGTTRLPVAGELDIIPDASDPFSGKLADGNRCWFRFTGPFEGTVDTISFDTFNSGLLAVNLGGRAYLMTDGDITFDPGSRRARASGTYAGTFAPLSNGAGGAVQIQGRFDYCHMSSEPECPYKVEGLLDYPLTVSASKLGPSVKAEATTCRALIDRETGGMQLDLQIGVWRGLNLAHLFDNCVDVLGLPNHDLINDNRLRFRTGGVTGPGTYGPFVAQTWSDGAGGEVVLPELEWKIPPGFAFLYTRDSGNTGVCSFLVQSGCAGFPCEGSYVRTQPGRSQCTVTVADPDQVSLRCEEVVTHIPNLPPFFEEGDFELDATCRITYR